MPELALLSNQIDPYLYPRDDRSPHGLCAYAEYRFLHYMSACYLGICQPNLVTLIIEDIITGDKEQYKALYKEGFDLPDGNDKRRVAVGDRSCLIPGPFRNFQRDTILSHVEPSPYIFGQFDQTFSEFNNKNPLPSKSTSEFYQRLESIIPDAMNKTGTSTYPELFFALRAYVFTQ